MRMYLTILRAVVLMGLMGVACPMALAVEISFDGTQWVAQDTYQGERAVYEDVQTTWFWCADAGEDIVVQHPRWAQLQLRLGPSRVVVITRNYIVHQNLQGRVVIYMRRDFAEESSIFMMNEEILDLGRGPQLPDFIMELMWMDTRESEGGSEANAFDFGMTGVGSALVAQIMGAMGTGGTY